WARTTNAGAPPWARNSLSSALFSPSSGMRCSSSCTKHLDKTLVPFVRIALYSTQPVVVRDRPSVLIKKAQLQKAGAKIFFAPASGSTLEFLASELILYHLGEQ